MDAVKLFIQSCNPAGWTVDLVDRADMPWYSYAYVRGVELLHSIACTRPKVNVSYNILCQFESEQGRVTKYIARVKYFVKVTPPAGDEHDGIVQPNTMRLAVSDLFKVAEASWGAGLMYHSPEYPSGVPDEQGYAVDMSADEHGAGCMLDKHVMALAGRSRGGKGAWFAPARQHVWLWTGVRLCMGVWGCCNKLSH